MTEYEGVTSKVEDAVILMLSVAAGVLIGHGLFLIIKGVVQFYAQ